MDSNHKLAESFFRGSYNLLMLSAGLAAGIVGMGEIGRATGLHSYNGMLLDETAELMFVPVVGAGLGLTVLFCLMGLLTNAHGEERHHTHD